MSQFIRKIEETTLYPFTNPTADGNYIWQDAVHNVQETLAEACRLQAEYNIKANYNYHPKNPTIRQTIQWCDEFARLLGVSRKEVSDAYDAACDKARRDWAARDASKTFDIASFEAVSVECATDFLENTLFHRADEAEKIDGDTAYFAAVSYRVATCCSYGSIKYEGGTEVIGGPFAERVDAEQFAAENLARAKAWVLNKNSRCDFEMFKPFDFDMGKKDGGNRYVSSLAEATVRAFYDAPCKRLRPVSKEQADKTICRIARETATPVETMNEVWSKALRYHTECVIFEKHGRVAYGLDWQVERDAKRAERIAANPDPRWKEMLADGCSPRQIITEIHGIDQDG